MRDDVLSVPGLKDTTNGRSFFAVIILLEEHFRTFDLLSSLLSSLSRRRFGFGVSAAATCSSMWS